MLVNVDARYLDWLAAIYLSQDEIGIKEITDDLDIHSDNQRTFVLPSRLIAKKFLFRIIFGGSAHSFNRDPEFKRCGLSLEEWEDVIYKFYRKYSGVHQWHEGLVRTATTTRRIEIPTGRSWDFAPRKNKFGELEWPITTIKNYPVQGLEADLMMIARVSLFNRIKHDRELLLINSVHDSILLDVPEEKVGYTVATIKEVFNDVPANFKKLFGKEFNLPFRGEVQVGRDWLNMEQV